LASNENQLIALLPRKDRARLLAVCEQVDMALAEVICDAGQMTRYAYFPLDGFISLVAMTDGDAGVEVGMVGSEGMLGSQLALGVLRSPLHAVVQGPGATWRIVAGVFRLELAASPALQRVLQRYICVLMEQMASSAACLRYHLITPRLARWLLMSQDRAHAAGFHITQEFLAYMLGVRRVGITTAASSLQRSGLIHYHRGELTVIDRAGLEKVACSCYAANCAAYAEIL
jgi:CRP-like cAMP-binding protein